MKLRGVVLTILLLTSVFSGCSGENNYESATPQRITVNYELDSQTYRTVTVDLMERTRKTETFADGSVHQEEDDFSDTQALADFLKSQVYPTMQGNGGTASVEQITWRIFIVTDQGDLDLTGLGDDPLPSYWDRLLILLGEK